MLTKLSIKNFKRLQNVEIELGQSVVFIGPNNSGKTTALQALMLWASALQHWQLVNLKGPFPPTNDPVRVIDVGDRGVTINRFDLFTMPVPQADLLWNATKTQNRILEVGLEGITKNKKWECRFKFSYGNEESLYALPQNNDGKFSIATGALDKQIAFLPSMSGLIATEPKVEKGRVNVLIGEGRTAEVLRNLCYQLYDDQTHWQTLVDHMRQMFTIELLPPEYLVARGEIRMAYKDENGITLDLSSAGRGMLQMLLLLAYLYANPGTVLLLDEPDAHLEILRQREVYQLLTTLTREMDSQLIIATHSEVILNEAGDQGIAIAFVGQPHRINNHNQRSHVVEALKNVGFEYYHLAEQTGWALYLEGSTDLAILQKFAKKLHHPVFSQLKRPLVKYVGNQPNGAAEHFWALKVAKSDLVGIAIFDRLENGLPNHMTHNNNSPMIFHEWSRREIENYLCLPEALLTYADTEQNQKKLMAQLIESHVSRLQKKDNNWLLNAKTSDEFLYLLFEEYFKALDLPNLMPKGKYHILVDYIPADLIATEVLEKLDAILAVAQRAQPRRG